MIKAHKFVLSLVSEVFRAQFNGHFAKLDKEKNTI
jgi:hypothetical protein